MAIDTSTGPYAVKPIRDFLGDFAPVQKAIADAERATLTYDILNWNFAPNQPPPCPNSAYGSLTIRLEPGQVYRVHQRTRIGGEPTLFRAEVICNADDTLRAWTLHTYRVDANGNPIPISELRESWTNEAGRIRSRDGAYHYRATRPVFSHWVLPHLLLRRPVSMAFDMLQDLSLFRPNQKLVPDGRVDLPVGSYDVYAQTGEGVLPIHYLLDRDRRPQLIAFGLIAWALRDVE